MLVLISFYKFKVIFNFHQSPLMGMSFSSYLVEFCQMKWILLCLFFSVIISNAQTYNLTINNGYSGGTYKAGTRVHIYSESNPNNNVVFNEWTSNIPIQMDQKDEWHTIITMPNNNVIINATFSQISGYNPNSSNFGFNRIVIPGDTVIVNIGPQFTTYGTLNYGFDTTLTPDGAPLGKQTTILEDRELFYYFPNQMKGIVDFYFWTNGTAEGWLNSSERFESVKHMLDAGYGVIIPQSEERMRKKNNRQDYDLNDDSVVRFVVEYRNIRNVKLTTPQLLQYIKEQFDVYQMKKINNTLLKQNLIDNKTCRYAFGFSAGAAFAQLIGFKLNYKAVACIGNSGLENLFNKNEYNYSIPTVFSYGENDEYNEDSEEYEIKDSVNKNCFALSQRNVANAHYSFGVSPIHPYRFTQVKGINSTESNQLYNDFISKGVTYTDSLSGQVYFKFPPTVLSRNKLQITKWNDLENNSPEISAMLENVIYQIGAGHCSRSDFDKKIIQFFSQQCDTLIQTKVELKQSEIHSFKVFPNPSNGEFNVVSKTKITHLNIINSCGQIVLNEDYDQFDLKINLKNKGLYYLILNHDFKITIIVND